MPWVENIKTNLNAHFEELPNHHDMAGQPTANTTDPLKREAKQEVKPGT